MSYTPEELQNALLAAGYLEEGEEMMVSMSNLSDFLLSNSRKESFVALIPARLNVAYFHSLPRGNCLKSVVFVRGSLRLNNTGRGRKSPLPVCMVRFGQPSPEPAKVHFLGDISATDAMIEKWACAASYAFEIMRYRRSVGENDRESKPMDESLSIASYACNMTQGGEQIIETHPALYEAMNEIFHFDCDPCPVFPKQDAMSAHWGSCAYVNAPFSYVAGFAARAVQLARESGTTTVLLAPMRTGTFWFNYLGKSGFLRAVVSLYGHIRFKNYSSGMMMPIMLVIIAPGEPTEPLFLTWDPNISNARRKGVMHQSFPEKLFASGFTLPHLQAEPAAALQSIET